MVAGTPFVNCVERPGFDSLVKTRRGKNVVSLGLCAGPASASCLEGKDGPSSDVQQGTAGPGTRNPTRGNGRERFGSAGYRCSPH